MECRTLEGWGKCCGPGGACLVGREQCGALQCLEHAGVHYGTCPRPWEAIMWATAGRLGQKYQSLRRERLHMPRLMPRRLRDWETCKHTSRNETKGECRGEVSMSLSTGWGWLGSWREEEGCHGQGPLPNTSGEHTYSLLVHTCTCACTCDEMATCPLPS